MYRCLSGVKASDEIDIGTDYVMVPAIDESEKIQTLMQPGYSNLGPNKPTVEQDAGLQRNLEKAWEVGKGQMVWTGSNYYQPTGPAKSSMAVPLALAGAVAAFLFLRRRKNPCRRRR